MSLNMWHLLLMLHFIRLDYECLIVRCSVYFVLRYIIFL
ncbi:Uncharacterised protein [Vibrio cholerae]|nr:Uncharacterised protein [Vibrio cholerae]CSC54959.1 Uncharacterised protein [Vibrio cholerae]